MKFLNLNIGARLWTGFGAISVLMVLVVAIGILKMNSIEAGVDNLVRASRNEMLAMQIQDGINAMRRYQLNALAVSAADRGKEMERIAAEAKETLKQTEELEKLQRHAETKKIATEIRELAEKYARGQERVAKLAQEGRLEEMKEAIQGEERAVRVPRRDVRRPVMRAGRLRREAHRPPMSSRCSSRRRFVGCSYVHG